MRRFGLFFTACLAVFSSFTFAADAAGPGGLRAGDRVAIIGDSITEQKQYSVYMEDYLLMCKPAQNLTTIQFGWSGETSWGFVKRMENDCLRFKPTVATTCYGMNDGGYSPQNPKKAEMYRTAQLGIVQGMKKAGVRFIVIGSPGSVDTYTFRREKGDTSDTLSAAADMYNATLASERDIAREIAQAEGIAFANVFDAMIAASGKAKANYGPKYHVGGGDGVHPAANGHLVMAYAFLKGLGCDGNIGTITLDLAANSAEATEGHKVLSAKDGSIEIESTRYPFCFPVSKTAKADDPNNVRSILPFVPFNEELNRYVLVVKGAGGGKVKVTWGETSKEFDAPAAAKGINLAAEFLDNPFVEPFRKVQDAIRQQQNYETPMIKQTIHEIAFPPKGKEKPADPQKIIDDASAKQAELSAAAVKAVEPVRHVIKVEAVK